MIEAWWCFPKPSDERCLGFFYIFLGPGAGIELPAGWPIVSEWWWIPMPDHHHRAMAIIDIVSSLKFDVLPSFCLRLRLVSRIAPSPPVPSLGIILVSPGDMWQWPWHRTWRQGTTFSSMWMLGLKSISLSLHGRGLFGSFCARVCWSNERFECKHYEALPESDKTNTYRIKLIKDKDKGIYCTVADWSVIQTHYHTITMLVEVATLWHQHRLPPRFSPHKT